MRLRAWMGAAAAVLATTAGLLVQAPLPASAQAPTPAEDAGLAPSVVAQMSAIAADKASRTPSERKVDSHLLYANQRASGERLDPAVPKRATIVDVGPDGHVEVDIDATVSDRLVGRIETLGGTVVTSVATMGAIRASVPLTAVDELSRETAVRHLRPAEQFMTNQIDQVTAAVAGDGPIANAGTVLSQADATHLAGATRTTYGIDGTGVTIGVLSDGVNTLAARQGTGDLPAVTVLAGQNGSGDEGTAMLKLVHDLAPGATLMFATALGGQPQFATNILGLQAAGADIIVDDITYFAESVFQPGTVEAAVNTVVAAGVVYLSSAGNSGNVPDGTSGTWVGPFVSAGLAGGPLAGAGTLLDFDQTAGVDSTITLAQNTGPVIGLTWNDPLGLSGNDYDLYVLNPAQTTILDAGANTQDGNDNPIELMAQSFTNEHLVVAKFNAGDADRHISLITNRGRFTAYGTGGASYGHNSGESAISVAATPANVAFQAGHPVGPFPGPHTNANVSEFFSSDGPRLNFFEADGTPIAGGETLTKPDLTAADGASTSTPGFLTFFGTSASVPHAAAIAALMMEANPSATGGDIRTAMETSTIDIEAAGDDTVTGTGILMASTAVAAVAAEGQMQFSSATYSVNEPAGAATITLTRTGGSDGAASVEVALAAGGTATEGVAADFTYPAAVTVNWADGDSADKTVNVPINDDVTFEGTETAKFVLQNATVAVVSFPLLTTLSILDDEAPPAPGTVAFATGNVGTGEIGPTATLTIDRTGGSFGAASVQVALAGGTATNGSDYSYTSPQTVSWADGAMGSRTVTVTINQDTVDEPNETINFVLQNPVTVGLGALTTSVVTIVDDDAAAPPPFEPPAPPTPEPPAEPNRDVVRLAGENRIATAIAASQEAFTNGEADRVVVARSDGFADALVGVPLAAAGNGPLLLTPPTGLDPTVLAEIQRVLGSGGDVRVLGGTEALAPAVVNALTAAGLDVERLAGANRFETALAVAAALGSPADIYLATGRNFPDALAAGAAAAAHDGAVLLTDDETVPAGVTAYLDVPGRSAIAVGGPASRALPTADAVVGENRYATAVLLAELAFGEIDVAGLATGENFPDALSGGAHIAHHGGPLLLTPGARLDAGVADYLGDHDPDPVYLYGGTAALSASVAGAVAVA